MDKAQAFFAYLYILFYVMNPLCKPGRCTHPAVIRRVRMVKPRKPAPHEVEVMVPHQVERTPNTNPR
jgi:hypothetical protein